MPRRSCDVGVKVRFFRDAWWVVVHHQGRRRRKRIGPDKKLAERVASEIRAKLVLGHFEMHRKVAATVPFSRFARDWLRREVELPIDRGLEGHLAPGTATIYRLQIDVHLVPFFGEADIRAVGLRDIQAFYDHCIDTGRPRSAKSIDMALNVLRQILSHARAQGLIGTNPVEEWKRGRPRRRASSSMTVSAARILSADELNRVLAVAAARASRFYPLILFLADTGCRLGEAFALRWSDLDLEGATARIARSFSSGEHLGPTRRVGSEWSNSPPGSAALSPSVCLPCSQSPMGVSSSPTRRLASSSTNTSARKSSVGWFGTRSERAAGTRRMTSDTPGRACTWREERRSSGFKPRVGGQLRRCSSIRTATLCRRNRAVSPTESRLRTAPRRPLGPKRRKQCLVVWRNPERCQEVPMRSPSATGPRSPIMHFTDPPPFFRNSETFTTTGVTPRSRTRARRRSDTPAGITRNDSPPRENVNELAA